MHKDEREYINKAYTTNWMSTVRENINKVEKLQQKSWIFICSRIVFLHSVEVAMVELTGIQCGINFCG